MGAGMGEKMVGKTVLLLGAALASLLFPGLRRRLASPDSVEQAQIPVSAGVPAPEPTTAASAAPALPLKGAQGPAAVSAPSAPAARPPKRMWALIQYVPEVIVLAVSPSRAELERELAELNATWNHWELRTERQRYAIQAAPVLYPDPAGATPARPMGSAAAG
ncbi:MAG: hypothetical protein ACO27F_14520 [Beijerinckiaceae bacterium]|jgi:hypothetical protein